ncbi:MAG TPA: dynamin family protein, partial [Candidatus Limnocylindrales bacterium]
MTAQEGPAAAPDVVPAVRAIAALARDAGRDDLALSLGAAAARCARPTTIVCVVGEFKQGKSTLVNSLIGTDLCPVDDDMATSVITLVHFGDSPKVTVRRLQDGEAVVETIDPATIRDWVTEAGNPDNSRKVERIDITVPSQFLAEGVAMVDTPGAGGIATGYAAATLAFLPFADGLIFVSDASAELSAPEVAFLAQARERCPIVIQALTKVDLYAEWRRIADLDREHLAKAGIDAETIPLSAVLRAAGLETLDPDLTRRSGYPELFSALRGGVIGPAKRNAADRAVAESTAALDLLEATAREELAVIEDPARLASVLARSEAARARLEHLKGPGSKWSTLVADRVSDLSNEANYRFKGSMRDVLREMDEYTEALKTPSDWDAAAARLQERVATAVSEVFLELDRGTETIRAAVMELLAEEDLALPATSRGPGVDVRALWRDQTISLGGTKAGRVAGTAMVGLRGAQSGMVMFGTITRLAPAGVAAVMLSNPVTIGLGAAFAGMQLLDAHRRRLNALRQQAKTHIRQFLDDVQFEVGNTIGQSVREIQRGLRDDFTAAIDGLARMYADMATQAQRAAEADKTQAAERSAALRVQLDQ